MKITVLASGSEGNCCLIQSKNASIVIDCGATVRYLKDSFQSINFDYTKIDAMLITHSHSDHLKQIKMFENAPFYSTFTINNIKDVRLINPFEVFKIKDLTICPVQLSHDVPTIGFIINDGKETLVQITDTGYVSNTVQQLIKGADYYIFESNHDVSMLMATNRPPMLKKRIVSDNGHMDNEYASNIIANSISDNTKAIVLAHISKEANTYQLAYETLIDTLKKENVYRSDLLIHAQKQFEVSCYGSLD